MFKGLIWDNGIVSQCSSGDDMEVTINLKTKFKNGWSFVATSNSPLYDVVLSEGEWRHCF